MLVFREIVGRRATERVIDDARRYAEGIVDTVREPLLVLDTTLRVKSASRSFYRTFRVAPDETENRLVYDLGDGQWDIPRLRTLLEEVLPQNAAFDGFEVEHDFAGLGTRFMVLNARKVYHPGSRAELILLAVEDVTDRKLAEQALAVTEGRYRRLFETAKDGVLILDADTTKITDANPFVAELLDYSPAELIGKELWEIGLFRDVEASKAAVRELQEQSYIRYDDLPLETKSGKRIDVEFVSNVYREGPRPVIQCNIRDVTARKRLEAAEREGERRLRFVMDSMPQKIVTGAPDGGLDYFNPQWAAFTGLPVEQIKGWGWTQFVHPDDRDDTVRLWRHAVATGEPFHLEHRFRRADGEYRWHLSRAVAMRDAGGAVVMWVGSNTDVHAQRQTANELRQFAADMSEADRRKDEFLAMLAHELRNPLAPIRNAMQVMRLAPGDAGAVEKSRNIVERQLHQMVRLVDDLLDVSRVSRGKIDLRRQSVEVAAVVRTAVETARPVIEMYGGPRKLDHRIECYRVVPFEGLRDGQSEPRSHAGLQGAGRPGGDQGRPHHQPGRRALRAPRQLGRALEEAAPRRGRDRVRSAGQEHASARRHQVGRTVRADRAAPGGARLREKKISRPRLSGSASGSSRTTRN